MNVTFLDIAGQNTRPKAEINNPKDRLDNYLEWAPRVLGFNVAKFVMTVPAFAEWLDYCEENDMDFQEYKGIPIVIQKDELNLKCTSILLEDMQ